MAFYKRYLVFSLFSALKNAFLVEIGVKLQNFEVSKKVPIDILDNVVSKFVPIPMKIVAGSLSETQQTNKQRQQRTFQYPRIPNILT